MVPSGPPSSDPPVSFPRPCQMSLSSPPISSTSLLPVTSCLPRILGFTCNYSHLGIYAYITDTESENMLLFVVLRLGQLTYSMLPASTHLPVNFLTSLLWLNEIPLWASTTTLLSVHQLMGI